MKIEKDTNILIVGLGLIGGSYARGLTKEGYHVNAIDCDQETVDYAIENKMIQKGTVQVDRKLIGEADLVIFNENEAWTVTEDELASKSHNTPFLGETLYGRVKYTICGGTVVYEAV